ncbi:MAG TPA: purine-nucleoside phosphorylase [Clostridiales bacterium]|nr:MAG: purine-nucleoside phosphorylase [Clostridiales bacterium GWD2_32_59]HAN09046.1 purine-nucleoside phosphorylase [Clostridiales bacterium]
MNTTEKDLITKIEEAKKYIEGKIKIKPEIGIVLGSGLGDLAEEVNEAITIKYCDIPHFKTSTVVGHDGVLIIGKFMSKNVVMMKGRVHFYEGYSMEEITFPTRVLKALGISKLIVTNAAGAINKELSPGELMIINDHINIVGINPLIGKNFDELGTRFPDMTNQYNKELIDVANDVAYKLKINIKEGVYAYMSGPNYETKAEINMLRVLGADAVGMSTVPEVIVARHSGIDTLGISCITNMASGILDAPLNHREVIEVSNRVKDKFKTLIRGIIEEM